jgi:hypothetical protein
MLEGEKKKSKILFSFSAPSSHPCALSDAQTPQKLVDAIKKEGLKK